MPGIDHFDKQTGLRDIEVSGLDGLAIAEEQAVLHAAQVARAQQVGRLVVVGRRDFEQFLVRRHDERPVSTSPNPQQVKTILEFIAPTAATPLPSGWTRREGLAIDAEEAWAALSPIYLNVAEARR